MLLRVDSRGDGWQAQLEETNVMMVVDAILLLHYTFDGSTYFDKEEIVQARSNEYEALRECLGIADFTDTGVSSVRPGFLVQVSPDNRSFCSYTDSVDVGA